MEDLKQKFKDVDFVCLVIDGAESIRKTNEAIAIYTLYKNIKSYQYEIQISTIFWGNTEESYETIDLSELR